MTIDLIWDTSSSRVVVKSSATGSLPVNPNTNTIQKTFRFHFSRHFVGELNLIDMKKNDLVLLPADRKLDWLSLKFDIKKIVTQR